MKKLITITILVLAAFTYKISSAQVFQKLYGGGGYEDAYFAEQTSDGGFILCGTTDRYFAADTQNVYVIKTDHNGDTLWTRSFGGLNAEGGKCVHEITGGGYIIVGNTYSFGAGGGDVYVIKTDANGDTLWTKTYGTTNNEKAYDIQQTTDGGYIISGTRGLGAQGSDAYLIKTDAAGNVLWSNTYGGLEEDQGYSVKQTTDGGYIIGGRTHDFNFNWSALAFYLVKVDANGNALWSKIIGGTGQESGYDVQQTSDGGYIMTGNTAFDPVGYGDVYLVKTDSMGNLLWSKTYGGPLHDYGHSVQQTADGGYVIAGGTKTTMFNDDGYVIKTNASGGLKWSRNFGSTSSDEFLHSIRQTTDNGFIISGMSGATMWAKRPYLIRLDSAGYGVGRCDEGIPATTVTTPAPTISSPVPIVTTVATIVTSPATHVASGSEVITICSSVTDIQSPENNLQDAISVYPNPFNNFITIKNNEADNKEIILFDITGKEILRQEISGAETNLNTEKLSQGFYLLSCNRVNIKLVKF